MIDISFNSQTKPIDISLQSTSELGIGLSSGVAIQGSIVIPNPETEPTDDLKTIKINSETFRIKDDQLADWAREETKPTLLLRAWQLEYRKSTQSCRKMDYRR